MNLQHWRLVRQGRDAWAVYQVNPTYAYDLFISCFVGDGQKLNRACAAVSGKRWGSQPVVDELREIVQSLGDGNEN